MKLIIPKRAQAPKLKTPPKRDILFGTGITKALATASEKVAEKSATKVASKLQVKKTDAESPMFKVGELPSSLMASGIVLDEYQSAALQGLRNQKYGCLIGAAGCVDATTEFLTPAGWKRIDQYEVGDQVAQFNKETGKACFTLPTEYIKKACSSMLLFKTKTGLNQCLSDEHRMLWQSKKTGVYHVNSASEIATKFINSTHGIHERLPVAFNMETGNRLSLTDAELRVQVAVIADGWFRTLKTCHVRLKKERKITRLWRLLTDADIAFKTRTQAVNSSTDEYCTFTFDPVWCTKVFSSSFWQASQTQLQIILDEVKYWDSSFRRNDNFTFSTTQLQSAEFIQYAAHATGNKASLKQSKRKDEYVVHVCTGQKTLSLQTRSKTAVTRVDNPEGYKYCFAVPDTFLILRRENCIFVTGNTGKTTTLKALIAEVEDAVPFVDINTAKVEQNQGDEADMHVAVCFCSFTGRAVQQMKRALPEKYHPLANTIHLTLGYKPTLEDRVDKDPKSDTFGEVREVRVFRPTFTEFNKLPYKICIVDEAGTVPINLWNELIAALPTDCRVFLIGDLNQLPPVQGRSVLGFAMLEWPTFTLEKLHRQAEGDPIAENAHRVLQGMKPLTDHETKKFIVKKVADGSLGARKETLMTIQHLHKQGVFNPLTDALIVPQNIDAIGQIELNQQLVNYFNPPVHNSEGELLNPRTIITAGYAHVVFAVGDKVMLLANDNQRSLTNGMIGVIQEIWPNTEYRGRRVASELNFDAEDFDLSDLADELNAYVDEGEPEDESERAASHVMEVKFQNVEQIVIFATAGEYKKISHAYAFTCHKAQGGEYPTVVILAHSANLGMLTREWLYTAITRAQNRVVLLCNHRGLTHAVNNQRIKGKTIADKAKAFLKLQGKEGTQLPTLPEPLEIRYAKLNRD